MTTAEHASVDALVRPIRPKRGRRRPLQQTAPEAVIDPVVEALRLLQRQARIRDDLRSRRGCYIVAERELLQISHRLAQLPAAVQSITLTAAELQLPRPCETGRTPGPERRPDRNAPGVNR